MAPAAVISPSAGRRAGPARRLLGDRHLGRLASNGDPRAFAAIYERHHQELYRYCRSITGNAEDASDALQNTMAAALRSLPGDRREIALRPWLFRVAHNESVSLMRRRGLSAELSEDSTSSAPGPHGMACLRERVSGLVANLRELPERQRGALVMRELNGLDYDEIATALGTSGAAARQAVYEARLALTELDEGREMACEAVRRSISARDRRVMRGRRLRAHLRECGRCADFREQVELRRSALSALLPPLPAAAGAAIFSGLIGGGGVGAGTSVGAAAGAGSGGVMSLFAGGLSQATGASAVAKSAAAMAVAVAAGVGTVEVARDADQHPSHAPRASVAASAPRSHATAPRGASLRVRRAPTSKSRRSPSGGERTGRREPSRSRRGGTTGERPPQPARPRPPTPGRQIEKVPGPAPTPVRQPASSPQAPAPAPAGAQPSGPTASQPWQQQYDEGMRRYQESMNLSRQVVQQTMQGVQQLMNGMFAGTGPR